MKKILLLIVGTCVWQLAQAQEGITICHSPATERFALLAKNTEFINSHQQPETYRHQSKTGKMITYPVKDGQDANAYFLKAKKPSNTYLLVIHEWWGLNEQIKREAEKLYQDLGNVNVLALDLYDGQVTDKRDEAAQYMQSVNTDRAQAIIKAAFDFAGAEAKIASIGWCFGGGWSLQTAILAGSQAVASVIYYGMPEKDIDRLKLLETDVLGIFAGKEQWISPKVVEEFAANMKKAGKQLEYKIFDAEHAFANPSNPVYDEKAAAEAYSISLNYLKKRL